MRPTSLTPETHRRIIELVRGGQFVTTTATLAGVHRDSIYEWLQRAEAKPDSIYAAFARDFRDAEAEFEQQSVAKICANEKGHKGLQWFLERRFPERFGRRLQTELSGPNGGPLQVAAKVVVLPELDDESTGGLASEPRSADAVLGKPRE